MTSQEFEKIVIGKMITNAPILETVFKYINAGKYLIDGEDSRIVLRAIKNVHTKSGVSKYAVAEELFNYYKEDCFNVINEFTAAANTMDTKDFMEQFLKECHIGENSVSKEFFKSMCRDIYIEAAGLIMNGDFTNIVVGNRDEVAYNVYLPGGVGVVFYKDCAKEPAMRLPLGNVNLFPISLNLIDNLYKEMKAKKDAQNDSVSECHEQKKVEQKVPVTFFEKFLK